MTDSRVWRIWTGEALRDKSVPPIALEIPEPICESLHDGDDETWQGFLKIVEKLAIGRDDITAD